MVFIEVVCSHTCLNISAQVPILGELALSPRTDFNRPALLAIYTPFLVVRFVGLVGSWSAGQPFRMLHDIRVPRPVQCACDCCCECCKTWAQISCRGLHCKWRVAQAD